MASNSMVETIDLGGVIFSVPIVDIKSTVQSNVTSVTAIRELGSAKSMGEQTYSFLNITLYVFDDDGLATVSRLINLYRNVPFTYIDSDYISSTFNISDVALMDITLMTLPGVPRVYKVELTLAPFDLHAVSTHANIKVGLNFPIYEWYKNYINNKMIGKLETTKQYGTYIPGVSAGKPNGFDIFVPSNDFLDNTQLQLNMVDTAVQAVIATSASGADTVYASFFGDDATAGENNSRAMECAAAIEQFLLDIRFVDNNGQLVCPFYKKNNTIFPIAYDELNWNGLYDIYIDSSNGRYATNSAENFFTYMEKMSASGKLPQSIQNFSTASQEFLQSVISNIAQEATAVDIYGVEAKTIELENALKTFWLGRGIWIDMNAPELIPKIEVESVATNGNIIKQTSFLRFMLKERFNISIFRATEPTLGSAVPDELNLLAPDLIGQLSRPGFLGLLYSIYINATLADMAIKEQLTSVKDLFDRDRYRNSGYIAAGLQEYYPQQVAVSFANKFGIAFLQNALTTRPVYSFLGSGDFVIQISCLAVDDGSNGELLKLTSAIDMAFVQSKKFQGKIPAGFVAIRDPLIQSMGVFESLITNYEISSVTDTPNLYQIRLTLTNFDLSKRTEYMPETLTKHSSVYEKDDPYYDYATINGQDAENVQALYDDWFKAKYNMRSYNCYPDIILPKLYEVADIQLNMIVNNYYTNSEEGIPEAPVIEYTKNKEAQVIAKNAPELKSNQIKITTFKDLYCLTNGGAIPTESGDSITSTPIEGEMPPNEFDWSEDGGEYVNPYFYFYPDKLSPLDINRLAPSNEAMTLIDESGTKHNLEDLDRFRIIKEHAQSTTGEDVIIGGSWTGESLVGSAHSGPGDLFYVRGDETAVEDPNKDTKKVEETKAEKTDEQKSLDNAKVIDGDKGKNTDTSSDVFSNMDPSDNAPQRIPINMYWIDDDKYNKRGSIAQLFPTFHILIIDEFPWQFGWKMKDFMYQSIKIEGLRVVINHDTLKDFAFLDIVNAYGDLTKEEINPSLLASYAFTIKKPKGIIKEILDPFSLKYLLNKMTDRRDDIATYFLAKAAISNVSSALFLRQGVRIQIRMGYESNPLRLKHVFTGRIQEIGSGDRFRIVCTGDGVEFDHPVERRLDTLGSGFSAGLVDKPACIYHVIYAMMNERGMTGYFGNMIDFFRGSALGSAFSLDRFNYDSPFGIEHFGYRNIKLKPLGTDKTNPDNYNPPTSEGYISDNSQLTSEVYQSWASQNYPNSSSTDKTYGVKKGLNANLGTFNYRDRGDGFIDVDPQWVSNSIVWLDVSEFVKNNRAGWDGKLLVNKGAAEAFYRAFEQVSIDGCDSDIMEFSGTYVARHIKKGDGSFTSDSLSPHSWGGAIDLNSSANWKGKPLAIKGSEGDMHGISTSFLKIPGFVWGGTWGTNNDKGYSSSTDGMHLEYNGPWQNPSNDCSSHIKPYTPPSDTTSSVSSGLMGTTSLPTIPQAPSSKNLSISDISLMDILRYGETMTNVHIPLHKYAIMDTNSMGPTVGNGITTEGKDEKEKLDDILAYFEKNKNSINKETFDNIVLFGNSNILDTSKNHDNTLLNNMMCYLDKYKLYEKRGSSSQDCVYALQKVADKHGVSLLWLFSHTVHESGGFVDNDLSSNGNIWSYGMIDSNPGKGKYIAGNFDGLPFAEKIIKNGDYIMPKIMASYLNQGGKYNRGTNPIGLNIHYARDEGHAFGVAKIMNEVYTYRDTNTNAEATSYANSIQLGTSDNDTQSWIDKINAKGDKAQETANQYEQYEQSKPKWTDKITKIDPNSSTTFTFIDPIDGGGQAHLNIGTRNFSSGNHMGIDETPVSGNTSRTIIATADGVVSKVAYDAGGYGNYIYIKHTIGGYTVTSVYGHLKELPSLKVGDVVSQGQAIGTMGSTGHSTGPHLHFELIMGDKANEGGKGYQTAMDPIRLIQTGIQTPADIFADFANGASASERGERINITDVQEGRYDYVNSKQYSGDPSAGSAGALGNNATPRSLPASEALDIITTGMTCEDLLKLYAMAVNDFVVRVIPFENRSTLFFGRPRYGCVSEYIDMTTGHNNFQIKPVIKPFMQCHVINGKNLIVNGIVATDKYIANNAVPTLYNGEQMGRTRVMVDHNIDSSNKVTSEINTRLVESWSILQKNVGGWVAGLFGGRDFVRGDAAAIARGYLKNKMREMYQGYFITLGMPGIKSYDLIHLFDEITEMNGACEAGVVIHQINGETGFTTSVKPNLLSTITDTKFLYLYGILSSQAAVYQARQQAIDQAAHDFSIIHNIFPQIVGQQLGKFERSTYHILNVAWKYSMYYGLIKSAATKISPYLTEAGGMVGAVNTARVAKELTELKSLTWFSSILTNGGKAASAWGIKTNPVGFVIGLTLNIILGSVARLLVDECSNLQSLCMIPLRIRCAEFSAGITGHIGSVLGDPKDPLVSNINTFLNSGWGVAANVATALVGVDSDLLGQTNMTYDVPITVHNICLPSLATMSAESVEEGRTGDSASGVAPMPEENKEEPVKNPITPLPYNEGGRTTNV